MDDLWSRIQAQNDEMDRQNEERGRANAFLSAHDAQLMAEQQNRWQPAPAQSWEVSQMPLSNAALRVQEREIDRQLELERSLAAGAMQQQQQRRGSNPAPGRSAVRLTHANVGVQKENRGKISLLPPRTCGAPPSSCGGTSQVPRPAPSVAGSVAPSVAGSMAPSLRVPRPVHFTHLMADKADSKVTQMDHFMNPVHGIRDQMKRAGIAPKDHIRENRALIDEMAAVQQQRREDEKHDSEDKKRRDALIRDRSRMRAQQTLHDLGAMDISDEQPISRGASAGRRSVRPPPTGQSPPPAAARPHEPGRVPAYLQRRKAEWAAEAEETAAREAAVNQCPPGTRLVGPEEKARILEKLAEERAKAAVELRQLPFVIKTNASQQKKDRLEARLEEIAGAEEAYMREKVFVPADM